jgi:hypothetical protein
MPVEVILNKAAKELMQWLEKKVDQGVFGN